MSVPTVYMLDYGAGNVRSVRNAIAANGVNIIDVKSPEVLKTANALIFPGVGSFKSCAEFLDKQNYRAALVDYIQSGRPFMGVCLGMQCLFERSEEAPGVNGLGIIPGSVNSFSNDTKSVPHVGWNGLNLHKNSAILSSDLASGKVYFVHSYRASVTPENSHWVLTTTDYNEERFISSVQLGNVFATQFHPEKSGTLGLSLFGAFLRYATCSTLLPVPLTSINTNLSSFDDFNKMLHFSSRTSLCKRIVACLDVRSNDAGDLVVTKGDQYDVREFSSTEEKRDVRNLGKPVDLCERYYLEDADEIALLNITAFREEPLEDLPMLSVLEAASKKVFVPLTIGGGIRSYCDSQGRENSFLDVASAYFRAGADKISIGSDAVTTVESYYAGVVTGESTIEVISRIYGSQAVVVSIDPKRVYLPLGVPVEEALKAFPSADPRGHTVVDLGKPEGPEGETSCFYICTIRGGREERPLCAVSLARAVQALGAGELLVNCVNADGQKNGYDLPLLNAICSAVSIPVIASSGAGIPQHFSDVFKGTRVEAALAAGIFHRKEVSIAEVKDHLSSVGIEIRSTL